MRVERASRRVRFIFYLYFILFSQKLPSSMNCENVMIMFTYQLMTCHNHVNQGQAIDRYGNMQCSVIYIQTVTTEVMFPLC